MVWTVRGDRRSCLYVFSNYGGYLCQFFAAISNLWGDNNVKLEIIPDLYLYLTVKTITIRNSITKFKENNDLEFNIVTKFKGIMIWNSILLLHSRE